jgi:CheY-like chemotaxis protein
LPVVVRAVSQPIFGGLRVVLLERDASDRELFQEALEAYGATVQAFADATAAAAAVRVQRPDVVVADLEAPGDSAALADAITALRLPLVATTWMPAKAEERPAGHVRRVNVRKPVPPGVLCQIVAEIVKLRSGGTQSE